ncbi:MAG: 6-phosphofructokinase, partial [Chloroflexota bacterium]
MEKRLVGNALVGQSGGCTAAMNSSLAGVLAEVAVHSQIGRVYGMRYGIQGALAGDLVDLSGLSAAVIDALRGTPAAALGTCRYRLRPEDPGLAVEVCRKHDVRYLFYIGGNDSADTAHRVALA